MLKSFLLAGALLAGPAGATAQSVSPNTGLPESGARPALAATELLRPFRAPSAVVFDSTRALSEVNNAGFSDAYPWLSLDGLRLYYQVDDVNARTLHMASRPTLSAAFGPDTLLPLPTTVASMVGVWLSPDELHAWYSGGGVLWHTTRASLTSPFAGGVQVTLQNLPAGVIDIVGVSLSAAGDELFYSDTGAGGSHLLRLTLTAPDTFQWVEDIALPTGYTVAVARLTDQDRRLMFGANAPGSGSSQLFEMQRPTPTDAFGPLQTVQVPANPQFYNYTQPCYRPDIDQLAYVTNQNSWTASDLWIATSGRVLGTGADATATRVGGLRLYPNPARATVHLIGAPAGLVQVLDATGRTVRTTTVSAAQPDATLSIEGLPAGLYTVRAGQQARRLVME